MICNTKNCIYYWFCTDIACKDCPNCAYVGIQKEVLEFGFRNIGIILKKVIWISQLFFYPAIVCDRSIIVWRLLLGPLGVLSTRKIWNLIKILVTKIQKKGTLVINCVGKTKKDP